MKFKLLYVFIFSSLVMFGAKLPEIENELVDCVKKITYWRINHNIVDSNIRSSDSLYYENNRLKALLLNYTVEEPNTISYPFDSLRRYIDIASSEDKKFRIYSWHIGQMDKMEYFINIFQYEAQGKVYSTMINYDDAYDPKGYYSQIHTLTCGTDTTIYMGYFHAFYTPKDFSDSYQTFQIVGNQLIDSIPIFKMKDSIMPSIEVLFHPVSQTRFMKKLIFYSPKKQQIRIRQTDNYGIILNKFKKLMFNGKQFEYLED